MPWRKSPVGADGWDSTESTARPRRRRRQGIQSPTIACPSPSLDTTQTSRLVANLPVASRSAGNGRDCCEESISGQQGHVQVRAARWSSQQLEGFANRESRREGSVCPEGSALQVAQEDRRQIARDGERGAKFANHRINHRPKQEIRRTEIG